MGSARSPDDVLRVLDFMMTRPVGWKGTTTELYTQLNLDSISVPTFGKHLAQNYDFMAGRGIVFTRIRTREGSILSLSKAEWCGRCGRSCSNLGI